MSEQRPAPDLLTLAEVAARVGVAVQTVRLWIRRGDLGDRDEIGFRTLRHHDRLSNLRSQPATCEG